jgi:hypothetical protein
MDAKAKGGSGESPVRRVFMHFENHLAHRELRVGAGTPTVNLDEGRPSSNEQPSFPSRERFSFTTSCGSPGLPHNSLSGSIVAPFRK